MLPPIKYHLGARIFPASQMQNADHVTTEGAKAFTDHVLRGLELSDAVGYDEP